MTEPGSHELSFIRLRIYCQMESESSLPRKGGHIGSSWREQKEYIGAYAGSCFCLLGSLSPPEQMALAVPHKSPCKDTHTFKRWCWLPHHIHTYDSYDSLFIRYLLSRLVCQCIFSAHLAQCLVVCQGHRAVAESQPQVQFISWLRKASGTIAFPGYPRPASGTQVGRR